MNILTAIDDPHIFATWFRRGEWEAWFAFLAALFGLPMTPDQLARYRQCTGRTDPPSSPAAEGWLICGRRAGKSFVLALVAVWLACFRDFRPYLSPGERATILVLATDKKQARTILRYIRALLTGIPMLAPTIERETAEAFDLTNSVTIEVATASYRKTRGYTIAAALCDELAFWPTDDSAEPDYAVLDAIRPGMATIPNAMLLCASSPYAKRGALWDAHRRYYGQDGPILVWQAATRTMNPTVPQRIIDEAMERDPASASSEYMAEFRGDIERLLSREAIEGAVCPEIIERPHVPGVSYCAFFDGAGGSGTDSQTLAISHREGDRVVIDALRERRPPFSPEACIDEWAGLLKLYRIRKVHGDRWAGEWPRERFRRHFIDYHVADKVSSDLYRDFVPVLNSGLVDLLDNERAIAQLVALERRTGRNGRDHISHPPGGHDDIAVVIAGSVDLAINRQHQFRPVEIGVPIIAGRGHASFMIGG